MSFVHRIEELVAEIGSGLTNKATHWERVPLGAIADVINGFPFPAGGFNNAEVGEPVVRIRDVTSGEVSTYFKGSVAGAPRIEHGDLVIGMDGDFNSRLWPGETALMNQRVCKVAPDDRFYSKALLAYALPGYLKLINDHTSAITVKHLSSKTVQDIPLALPPRAEQDRLASKIDELFSRIDEGERALERVSKLAERYRQSVLKAAVTGELTRNWREQRKAAGQPIETGQALLARILTARREAWEKAELSKMQVKGITPNDDAWKKKYNEPAPLDGTDLPELPEEWVWASFDQIFTVASDDGKKLKESEYLSDGDFAVIDQGAQFISGWTDREGLLFSGPLPVIGFGDHTRRFKLIDMPFVVGADGLKLFHASHGFWNEYAMASLRAAKFEDRGYSRHFQFLKRVAFPLPSETEQMHIAEIVARHESQIDKLIEQLRNECKRVSAARQSILKSAFNGELVAQDSTDESASALLGRITAERAVSDRSVPKLGRKKKST